MQDLVVEIIKIHIFKTYTSYNYAVYLCLTQRRYDIGSDNTMLKSHAVLQ